MSAESLAVVETTTNGAREGDGKTVHRGNCGLENKIAHFYSADFWIFITSLQNIQAATDWMGPESPAGMLGRP